MGIHIVKAFTNNPLNGNGAGVVLDGENFTDVQKLEIAKAVGLSETAFVSCSEKADFKVRFFTTEAEVDLCGHATIATFYLMKNLGIIGDGEYTQETKAGILSVSVSGDKVLMEQEPPKYWEVGIEVNEIASSLGIDCSCFHKEIPLKIISTGLRDLFIAVKSREILNEIVPDFKKISDISEKLGVIGYHIYSINMDKSLRIDAFCRNMAPLYGIEEESATGTSSGALACYLKQLGVAGKEQVFLQGEAMGNPCKIEVFLGENSDGTIKCQVGGTAVLK